MINYGDILVLFIIACAVGLIIGKMVKDKKTGRHCGGCMGCGSEAGCTGCKMSGQCPSCKR